MAIIRLTKNRSFALFEQSADRLVKKHFPFAMAQTLTKLAQNTKSDTVRQMRSRFDRPTPWTLNSLFVQRAEKADGDKMVAIVNVQDGKGSRRYADQQFPAMGETFVATGADKRAVIGHQFSGGQRQWKRFESRLRAIGILPPGLAAVPPAKGSWAMPLDRYGNAPSGRIMKILSYFAAFTESGSAGNTTTAGRFKLAKTRQSKQGGYTLTTSSGKKLKRGYLEIGGVVYFVSRGRGVQHDRDAGEQRLPPGIWAKRGIHGSDVAPVLLFVRRPRYRYLIDLPGLAAAQHRKNFGRLFKANLAAAVRTAR